MASGWAGDGAVQDQIEDTVSDAVMAARLRMPTGLGTPYCVMCGEDIPEPRRQALPGARTCIGCQASQDADRRAGGINRRASKDSQLR
ncbi:DksA/TraR family C4-type zinc finger protein [Sphingomonas sp. SUN019]|uniref:DksA/TraR family C4-type zinc finger protein n=1 Tax=Sphingomonas sp. SUN019 TaxID=2937788 RepID=UPI0021646BE9|nr:DksA/TraR family C4-type zinc finger protein [Sphingomonas sp. SUN019]UVO50186.1 DksA/TraR family C4-type zinc finger protein [Sphingomonas sp. SUN019]